MSLKFLYLPFYLVLCFTLGTPQVGAQHIYYDGIISKYDHKDIKPLIPLKTPKLAKQAPLKYIAAPKSQTANDSAINSSAQTSGCVTGYSTANYALNQIIAHESGGRSCATNAGGCFGLLQACPGYPLRAACGGNPGCQIQWFIDNKTGGRSWEQIWSLWQTQGWW